MLVFLNLFMWCSCWNILNSLVMYFIEKFMLLLVMCMMVLVLVCLVLIWMCVGLWLCVYLMVLESRLCIVSCRNVGLVCIMGNVVMFYLIWWCFWLIVRLCIMLCMSCVRLILVRWSVLCFICEKVSRLLISLFVKCDDFEIVCRKCCLCVEICWFFILLSSLV